MQLKSENILTMKKLDAWATFLKTFSRLTQKMEEELKIGGFPSLETYDLLWTLENAPDYRLRFNELGEKVFLSRYNVTRISKRLEEQGIIKRVGCKEDKRGLYAELTKEGLKLRKEMWGLYSQLIDRYFSSLITQNDHKNLIEILQQVYPEKS